MHTRFIDAFAGLPASLQSALEPILSHDDFPAMFTAEQVGQLKSKTSMDDAALAFALLPLAAACSLTPISHFHVGAVARGVSGNLYFGANMEFSGASMQQTVHAEQSAVTHAWMRGEPRLASITVNYTPCGHCRQFMNELNSGTELAIHLPERAVASLGEYLPYSFGPRDLEIETLLMDKVDHGYRIESQDALALQALDACNQSHAPYSQSHSGIALESASGKVFTGRYAENAAFNPSLPPLQAALVVLNLAGEDCLKIRRAVLIERTDPLVSQFDATRATLAALGCHSLAHTPL
ncbi:cytidine deaminase [Rouxiella sp. S1S-2]|uniref:cytidine deaminase n=1 Tax=Rouxiella sp. S1S-2 TaxID=2653856 RepID=UPI001264B624|nr:cytidine deaminase [Rouxiella sp. S1S-2]KAB7897755.1 cytidine deaminase [Rouxiella sp. S1S-2]